MASIYDWSTTAGSNSSSDSGINWAEGQDPGTVNDSARQMMGRVAEILGDIGGALSAGGTADGLTVTANSAFTTLIDGRLISFRATADNTGAATLNVNGIGAKSLRKMNASGDVALSAGDIQNTGIYMAQYSAALNGAAGAWLLVNPTLTSVGALTVTGAFTSLGIDDNATGEMFQLADTLATWGSSTSASTFSHVSSQTNGRIILSGGSTNVLGSSIRLHGQSHATNAEDIQFLAGPDLTFFYDRSLNTHTWYSPPGTPVLSLNTAVLAMDGQITASSAVTVAGKLTANGDIDVEGSDYSMTDASVGLTIYSTDPIINIGRNSDAGLQVKRRSTDGAAVNFYKNETNVGTISVAAASTAYNTSSDGRKKENFRPFDSGSMLDQIEFGQFEWISTGETAYGVIAQQVLPIYPHAISEEGGWLFADYSKLVPLLGAEIKALRGRVAELEAHSNH
jgi:hypothetical protein